MMTNWFPTGTTPAPTTTQAVQYTEHISITLDPKILEALEATTTKPSGSPTNAPFCDETQYQSYIGWVCAVEWFQVQLPDDVWMNGRGAGENVEACDALMQDYMPNPAYTKCRETWLCSSASGHQVHWVMDIDWANESPNEVFGPGNPGILLFAFSECHSRFVEPKIILIIYG